MDKNPCPCGKRYCNHLPKAKKIPKRIAPVSAKKLTANKEYSILARQFKIDNPVCKVRLPGCTRMTEEVHHKRGRLGSLLLDTNYFLPTCHNCHMWITENSEEAIRLGFSLPRNQK